VRKVLAKSFLEPKAEEEEEVKKKARQGKGKKKRSQRKEPKLFFFAFLSSHFAEGESFQHHPFGQQNPIQPRAKLYGLDIALQCVPQRIPQS
jgi:hypothetical protein